MEESKVVEPVAEEVVKVVEPAVPSAPAAPLSWAARMKMNQNAAASGALPGAPAVQPTPIPPKPEPVKVWNIQEFQFYEYNDGFFPMTPNSSIIFA